MKNNNITFEELERQNREEQKRVEEKKKAIAALKKEQEEADKKRKEAENKQKEAEAKRIEAENKQKEAEAKRIEAENKQKEVDAGISKISNVQVNSQQPEGNKTLVKVIIGVVVTVALMGATHHIGKACVKSTNCASANNTPDKSVEQVYEEEQQESLIVESPVEEQEFEQEAQVLITAQDVFNNNNCVQELGFELESVENVVAVLQGLPIINQNAIINSAEEVEEFLNSMRNSAITTAIAGQRDVFEFSSLYANHPESIEYKMLKMVDESQINVNGQQEAVEHIDLIVNMLLGQPVAIDGKNVAVINLADSKAMGVLAYAALTHDAMLSITYNENNSLLMDEGIQLDENGNEIVGVVEGRRQSFSIELYDIDNGCENTYSLTKGN